MVKIGVDVDIRRMGRLVRPCPAPEVDGRGYGFRVPALLVSPYAKRGVVDHTILDYTAMLHFIESNWKLAPLSTRDKQSAGLASAFDFSAAPRPATLLPWTWPAPQAALSTNNPRTGDLQCLWRRRCARDRNRQRCRVPAGAD